MGFGRISCDKKLLKLILHLSWPAILEQILQTVVQMADSAMVGRLSAQASAAVGVTTTAMWLLNGIFFAAAVGVLAFIARSVGAQEYDQARIGSVQAIILTIILGVVVCAIALSISGALPAWMDADPEIREDASAYFFIICTPMVFRASAIIFGSVIRAAGDTRTPMLINALMNILNVVLNFLLIYPTKSYFILGTSVTIPGAGLGVRGAAFATALSFVVGGILMFLVFYYGKQGGSPKGMKLRVHWSVMRQCITVSIPNALERMTACLGQMVFTSMVAGLGTIPLAAHSIAITAEQAFYIPGYGFQTAANMLSGQTLGERDEKKLDSISLTITIFAVSIMTLTALILFLFPEAMMKLFTTDNRVIELGASVLRIVSFSEPFFAVSIITEGVFNGVGDTKAPFVISLITMWAVRVLSTFVCVKLLGLGLTAVWVCMVADVVIRCILMAHRFFSGAWKRGRFESSQSAETTATAVK